MPQPPRNDGWKHAAKPNAAKPPANKPAPNTSRRPWQPGAAKPKTTAKGTSRGVKFVAAGVGVGLLTAAVVWVVLLLIQPNYPSLVIVANDTPDSLASPENAAGVASGKAVADWATGGDARAKLTADHTATGDRDSWRTKLDGNSKGLVLYFAAHVGCDAGRGPYLWQPPAGGAVSKADKLYVADILERLAKLPESQPKLLVLDISQTPANWAFGGAYSDFARGLKGMESQIHDVGELAVLLSADDDQVSWVADERRMSAFGFFFAEGLRGAAGSPGGSVTAAGLHKYLLAEVQKWAVANRGANQEPVLLPKADGTKRAEKLKLTTLPTTAYTPATSPEPAAPTPPALLAEWKRAHALSRNTPSPDTTDPLKWREYLEWLMRWDRLVRLNAVPDTLPPRARRLGDELETRAADDVTCGNVALPAGAALSGTSGEKFADVTFAKLWEPPAQSDHTAEWGKLLAGAKKEAGLRTAVARFAIDKVLADGVSRGSLETADKVLKAVGGVPPVEAHFVRMLHLHLPGEPKARTDEDVKTWPSGDLLRTAIRLRRTAEEAAWADGFAYPEQAIRWSTPLLEAADKERQLGEDLLFDTDPKSRAEAAEQFERAAKGYAAVKGRSKVVADSLAARDRVYARLPYYARWVASARGGPANAADLLGKLVLAAEAAHQIDKLTRGVTAAPTDADLAALAKAATDAALLDGVAEAYDLAVKAVGGSVQGSTWHELDAAQSVPFRAIDLGPDLAERARTVAVGLATAAQQPGGTRGTDFDPLATAGRHLRAASAYLQDPTLGSGAGLGEKPVKLADQVADKLHGLPAKATTAVDAADAKEHLRDTGAEWGEANRLARLCDPAAPVGGSPTPPEAERRFRRHYLLLTQAKRITLDGWCSDNPAEQNVVRWYCSLAAKLVFDSADAELWKLAPGLATLPPIRSQRLTADLTDGRNRMPTVLEVKSAGQRVIVPDERHLRFTYEASVKGGERIGFPVAEYTLPAALAKANPTSGGRRLERQLAAKKAGTLIPQTATFAFPPSPADAGADTLAAALRYRGRVYRADTELTFADKPNLRVENTPPSGNAVMALQADADAVNGAVVILIDRTQSMLEPKTGKREATRFFQARVGVRDLVSKMPKGTQLAIAGFYGKNSAVTCAAIRPPARVVEPIREAKKLFDDLEKEAEPADGSYTPLAGVIRNVLDPIAGKEFWPADYTGQRTLIVLTDGEDTWYDDGNPGYTVGGQAVRNGDQWRVVEAGLKAAVAQKETFGVGVHLVLFGMSPKEEARVNEQFEKLETAHEKDSELTDARFRMVKEVKDGADFANRLSQAVMPRVRYKSDGIPPGVMTASRKDEADADKVAYNPTPALKPGSYTLTDGVNKLPLVQLGAGERAILRAVRTGEKILLTRPPVAYELAKADNLRHATAGNLALTVPEIKYERGTPRSRIEAVLTLEELSPVAANDLLIAPSRYFAWFDVSNPDGSNFDTTTGPQVLIRNRLEAGGNELLAPAWDVKVNGWDFPKDVDRYRRPQVTALWLNGLPHRLDVQNVTPNQVKEAATDAMPLKAFTFGSGQVSVLDTAITERDRKLYLTVWMDYQKPGELVLLKAFGNWKCGQVAESHTYYDRHARYTAEFGPFSADDLVTSLSLELYSVADIRKRATQDRRVVTLKGDSECADRFTLPRRLFLAPRE